MITTNDQGIRVGKQGNRLEIHIFGGAGDVLAITPALTALKRQVPQRKLILYFTHDQHLKLLGNNPNIDQFIKIKPNPQWWQKRQTLGRIHRLIQHRLDRKKRTQRIRLSVGSQGSYTVYRKKMSEILADALSVEVADQPLEIHLTNAELALGKKAIRQYINPVVINPINRSRRQHSWPISRWAKLIALFPELTFVQVGLSDEPLIKGAVDARDDSDNSLRESVALLKFATAYIGMDTFWQHAAAAVNTPGVVLHSDGHPTVFGHDLHTNLYQNLHCAPCLSRLGNSPCPYDAECITTISVNSVANALTQQLKNRQHLSQV